MFALQAGAIRNALVQAGIPMRAAQQLSAILSNTAAEYRTGKITQDTTPDNLSYVDRDARKQQLTGIDPLADDPDYRSPQLSGSEGRVPAREHSDVSQPTSAYEQPQGRGDRTIGGPYVLAKTEGGNRVIGLKVSGTGTHPTLDPQAEVMIGKAYRAEVGNEDLDKIRMTIAENGTEVLWKTQLVNLSPIVCVTLEGQANGNPVYGTRLVYAWTDRSFGINGNGGPPGGPPQSLNVVTSVQWTGDAIVGTYSNVTVSAINGGGSGVIAEATECQ